MRRNGGGVEGAGVKTRDGDGVELGEEEERETVTRT